MAPPQPLLDGAALIHDTVAFQRHRILKQLVGEGALEVLVGNRGDLRRRAARGVRPVLDRVGSVGVDLAREGVKLVDLGLERVHGERQGIHEVSRLFELADESVHSRLERVSLALSLAQPPLVRLFELETRADEKVHLRLERVSERVSLAQPPLHLADPPLQPPDLGVLRFGLHRGLMIRRDDPLLRPVRDVDDTVVFYLIARRAVPLVVASARDRPVFLRSLELFRRDRARCHARPAVGRRNHRVRARGARRDARLVRLRLARAARTGDLAQDIVVQGRVGRVLVNGHQVIQSPEGSHF